MSAIGALPEIRFSHWKNLDAHLIWIYEGAPQVATGVSTSSYYSAWCLRRGRLELEEGGTPVEPGQWVILPPGESWRRFSPRASLLSISFLANWVTGHRLFAFERPLVFKAEQTRGWLAPATPMLRLVRRRYPDAYNRLPAASADYTVYAELQGYFQRWLARLWQGLQAQGVEAHLPPFGRERSLEMKRWLDAWPLHQPLRQPELAKAFNLSVTQANRLFCAAFEITPKRYFNQRRLAYAKGALRSSSRSVKEISYAAGFRHVSEFSAWFKAHSGDSPSRYRSRLT